MCRDGLLKLVNPAAFCASNVLITGINVVRYIAERVSVTSHSVLRSVCCEHSPHILLNVIFHHQDGNIVVSYLKFVSLGQ